MKHNLAVDKLSKLLVYILGRQPDEFGLCPDENGYVKSKDLMKALGEEPGWRHVRSTQIREVIYTLSAPPVEMENDLIRAVDRSRLFLPEIAATLPKLLYFPIRRRAYPVLLEKGLRPADAGNRIILAAGIPMAQRLGRRIDPFPVILTVNSDHARKNGATVWRFGQQLFLSDGLPLGSFSGPPLPRHRPEPKKTDMPPPLDMPKTPGSFLLDPSIDPVSKAHAKREQRKHKNQWKQDRKRISRNKVKGWSEA